MKQPQTPPREDAFQVLMNDMEVFREVVAVGAIAPTVDGKYVHWDELRRRTPPGHLAHETWWAAIKMARKGNYRPFPVRDRNEEPFVLAGPDLLWSEISEIDRDLSGRVRLPPELVNDDTRDRYRVSAFIEEAITSSQLEGATTTGVVARAMIRSNRKPANKDERMILNNFHAMELVRDLRGQPLTVKVVRDLHRTVTEGTLDDPEDGGRIRTNDDVRVHDQSNEVVHVPPSAASLDQRMLGMCAFANGEIPDSYVHPIVRAVILHFWLAYDHPFVDGNGRTARALFYWSMLSADYPLCEFVSISHILRKAPAQYARSYLYTESDGNDLTYFVLHQLAVLRQGIRALHRFVASKASAISRMRVRLRAGSEFNHRQLALLDHAMTHPLATYTVVSHSTSHDVTRQTARVDLTKLVDRGFLSVSRSGKRAVYSPASDLEKRLASSSTP